MHLADRAPEALEAIEQAEAFAERIEERWWHAELHRLRGVFLANVGAEETHNRGFILRSHQNRKGAEVDFARETRRSNLRRILAGKKRARQEDVDSDYLFDNFLQRRAFRSRRFRWPTIPVPMSMRMSFSDQ